MIEVWYPWNGRSRDRSSDISMIYSIPHFPRRGLRQNAWFHFVVQIERVHSKWDTGISPGCASHLITKIANSKCKSQLTLNPGPHFEGGLFYSELVVWGASPTVLPWDCPRHAWPDWMQHCLKSRAWLPVTASSRCMFDQANEFFRMWRWEGYILYRPWPSLQSDHNSRIFKEIEEGPIPTMNRHEMDACTSIFLESR